LVCPHTQNVRLKSQCVRLFDAILYIDFYELYEDIRMGGQKQKSKFSLDWVSKEAPVTSNFSVSARNLRKSDLGAVIFGCTHNTINECLSKQLFANTWEDDSSPQGYDDKGNLRQELKTSGRFMEENNWDGKWDQPWESDEDPQVNTTIDDFPLNQDYKANGMEENKWGGEWEQPWGSDVNAQANIATDHTDFLQENTLEESQPVSATTYKVELIQTEESESSGHISDNNPDFNKSETNESDKDSSVSTIVAEPKISIDVPLWVLNLIDEVKSLKGSQLNQIVKINMLEKRLVESKQEVQQLKNRICSLEHGSQHVVDPVEVDDHKSIKTQSNFVVESFIPSQNQWVPRPPLFWKNIHVAGASVKDRLFVVGGAKGRQCSSEVEYLDLDIGKWIPTCPMLSKRLAPAMAELNNAFYVSGGYDGASYISSFERHDPREEAWEKLPSMKTKKGCHSMVILNEKLYTLGGFDGEKYVPAVECFDTRMGFWVEAEPMNISRGNFGAFVLDEKLYTIGGVKENEVVMDIVECFKEGSCWEIVDLKAIGKRSHFSAIVA
ncbi:putative development/cell death domain, kelch-type beta propeller containing protein, partial [Tanacetum coccineum]